MKSAERYYAPQDVPGETREEVEEEEEHEDPGQDGLGHHGDPGDQSDTVGGPDQWKPSVIRVPREPTPKEREVHEATHLPHAEWCEYCMRGRARNKGHRKDGSGSRACADPGAEVDGGGPVPKISLDYFFLGDRHPKIKNPTANMSTRQLRKKLRIE